MKAFGNIHSTISSYETLCCVSSTCATTEKETKTEEGLMNCLQYILRKRLNIADILVIQDEWFSTFGFSTKTPLNTVVRCTEELDV